MSSSAIPGESSTVGVPSERRLTASEFHTLAAVPPESDWFANITNPNTRRAYREDVREFMSFIGIQDALEMRLVSRAHILAWRKTLEERLLKPASIRRKLSAVSSLFERLCGAHAITHNPAKGVKRPSTTSDRGATPAIGDHQAKRLLEAPAANTLKGKRDRAILSVFLYHALRRDELCKLCVRDRYEERGVTHLRVHGKGAKTRSIPLHPDTAGRISDYLVAAGHGDDRDGPLFRAVRRGEGSTKSAPVYVGLTGALTPDGVYRNVVRYYGARVQIEMERFGPHALRATAATNALEHEADIAKVQQWLGHANVSTTRVYDKRELRPQDSPTFKVNY